MAQEFFPYPAFEGVTLELQFKGAAPKTSGHVHDFSDSGAAKTGFDIDAEATVSSADMIKVLDAVEHQKPPVEVVLRVLAIESRQRRSIPMKQVSGVYTASLTIDPGEWFGEISIEAVVLRTSQVAHAAFASDKGAIVLFTSGAQVVRLDRPPEIISGKGLQTRWEDFTDPKSAWHSYSQHLYAIDIGKNPPELVLNSGLAPQVRPVLDGLGTSGLKARVRDVSLAAIASTAIASLLAEVLYAIAREDPPGLDNLHPWQRSLVDLAAPIFYPDLTPSEAATRLLKDLEDGDGAPDLTRQKVPMAAQQLARTATSVQACVIEAVNNGS